MTILAVLDTNIIVSAGIRPGGPPARIVDAALAGVIIPVVHPVTIAEYLEVVQRPRFRRWNFPPRWLHALIAGAHLVDHALPPWASSGPDPDDVIFLQLAQATGGVVITGNLTDYPPTIRHGVTVIDPTTYLGQLDASGARW